MDSLILLSGGLDSTVAYYWARSNGYLVNSAITFDYGSKHNAIEHSYCEQTCQSNNIKLIRVSLDFSYFKSDLLKHGGEIPVGHFQDPIMIKTVVPFRNGIMLSFAAGLADSLDLNNIILGNHFGDHAIYPDCRCSFIEPMSRAVEQGTYRKLKIISPFLNLTKAQIISLGSKLGVPFKSTYSCYKGKINHCGECGACVERREGFKLANVKDETIYEV